MTTPTAVAPPTVARKPTPMVVPPMASCLHQPTAVRTLIPTHALLVGIRWQHNVIHVAHEGDNERPHHDGGLGEAHGGVKPVYDNQDPNFSFGSGSRAKMKILIERFQQ
jgi:hypothetical protein